MRETTAPANAADVRRVVKERLAALREEDGLGETVRVDWRGQQKVVPVIDMPLSLLTLNPDTHRVRAQKTYNPSASEALDAQPYAPGSQSYLAELLKGDPAKPASTDPAFEVLKRSLQQNLQKDPGLITQDGVLVNGNTRCVALRELGAEYMRVGVLPPDASADDIQAIELALQLRKEDKRDYSFINRLIAIRERVQNGTQVTEVAREFHMRSKTVERDLWILGQIEDAIRRSEQKMPDGRTSKMKLVDFEQHQGKLEELHRRFALEQKVNSDHAEALFEQRLLALLVGKSKTDLRLIDYTFGQDHAPELLLKADESARAAGSLGQRAAKVIPGTSISAGQPDPYVQRLRTLTDTVLKAKATPIGPGARETTSGRAQSEVAAITEIVDRGLDKAGRNARLKQRQGAPAERISDAADDLQKVVGAIADARAGSDFSASDIDDSLVLLQAAVRKVAQHLRVERDAREVGEGIQWLLHAAQYPRDDAE